jgi:hypothetical protein
VNEEDLNQLTLLCSPSLPAPFLSLLLQLAGRLPCNMTDIATGPFIWLMTLPDTLKWLAAHYGTEASGGLQNDSQHRAQSLACVTVGLIRS